MSIEVKFKNARVLQYFFRVYHHHHIVAYKSTMFLSENFSLYILFRYIFLYSFSIYIVISRSRIVG